MSEHKFFPTPGPWEFLEDRTGIVVFKMRSLAGGRPTNDTIAHLPKLEIAFNSSIKDDEVTSNARLFMAAPRMLRAIISMVGQGERGDFIGRTSPNVNSLNTEGEKGIRLAIEILNELDPGGVL